jgi:hypothetical protein
MDMVVAGFSRSTLWCSQIGDYPKGSFRQFWRNMHLTPSRFWATLLENEIFFIIGHLRKFLVMAIEKIKKWNLHFWIFHS